MSIFVKVNVCLKFARATAECLESWAGAQLCCSVLDSIGGAESYRVSVS